MKMMQRSVSGMMIALAISFAGCSQKPAAETGVLAKVGTRVITVDDFQREVKWRAESRRPLPDKQALLDELIDRELRVQKARAAGLENDPDIRRAYENLLAAKLDERELSPRIDAVNVSPAEVQAAYEKDLARYTRPAKAHLALIYIKTDAKMNEARLAELKSRMADAREQAAKLPASARAFDRVAIDYSDDQASRYRGGDIGWLDEGQPEYRWPMEVIAAGFALKNKGDISDVLQTTNGFYLVKKIERREQTVTPLEQVRVALERRLASEKKDREQNAFARELRAAAAVQIHADALAGVEYPAVFAAKARETLPPAMPRSP